jgi:hypothetical protein
MPSGQLLVKNSLHSYQTKQASIMPNEGKGPFHFYKMERIPPFDI